MIALVGTHAGQLIQRPTLHPGPMPCDCVYIMLNLQTLPEQRETSSNVPCILMRKNLKPLFSLSSPSSTSNVLPRFWLQGVLAACSLWPSYLGCFLCPLRKGPPSVPTLSPLWCPKAQQLPQCSGRAVGGGRVNTTDSRSHQKLFNSYTLILSENSGRRRPTPCPCAQHHLLHPLLQVMSVRTALFSPLACTSIFCLLALVKSLCLALFF